MQMPTSAQTEENRRLLKELDEQKKKFKLQQQLGSSGVPLSVLNPSANSATAGVPPLASAPTMRGPPGHGSSFAGSSIGGSGGGVTPAQKAALDHAQANSFGYFITQDSSFGNLILPVLPRLDK